MGSNQTWNNTLRDSQIIFGCIFRSGLYKEKENMWMEPRPKVIRAHIYIHACYFLILLISTPMFSIGVFVADIWSTITLVVITQNSGT